jgi:cytochrome P450
MQLAGKGIRKGVRVVAGLGAANRDPKRFFNPDRLDLLRSDNRHIAFGWAGHFCFWAPLARMEGQIAFNSLLRRVGKPRLVDETCNWRDNAGLKGMTTLQVRFEPVAAA